MALLGNREGGTLSSFDDLAAGLDTGTITRDKAIKLAGSALVASAVGLLGANEAQAEVAAEGRRRRLCNRKGGDYCNTSGGDRRCSICCGEGGPRRKAC